LFELHQRLIDRAVVDRQLVFADLFDASRDAVAIPCNGPSASRGLERHQRELALPDIGFLTYGF
jgi:hypothetical protein